MIAGTTTITTTSPNYANHHHSHQPTRAIPYHTSHAINKSNNRQHHHNLDQLPNPLPTRSFVSISCFRRFLCTFAFFFWSFRLLPALALALTDVVTKGSYYSHIRVANLQDCRRKAEMGLGKMAWKKYKIKNIQKKKKKKKPPPTLCAFLQKTRKMDD